MIKEIAKFSIQPGMDGAFERVFRKSKHVLEDARGYVDATMLRGLEDPLSYTLIVTWKTLEDHVVHFLQSPAFEVWRDQFGPTLAAAPNVFHVQTVG